MGFRSIVPFVIIELEEKSEMDVTSDSSSSTLPINPEDPENQPIIAIKVEIKQELDERMDIFDEINVNEQSNITSEDWYQVVCENEPICSETRIFKQEFDVKIEENNISDDINIEEYADKTPKECYQLGHENASTFLENTDLKLEFKNYGLEGEQERKENIEEEQSENTEMSYNADSITEAVLLDLQRKILYYEDHSYSKLKLYIPMNNRVNKSHSWIHYNRDPQCTVNKNLNTLFGCSKCSFVSKIKSAITPHVLQNHRDTFKPVYTFKCSLCSYCARRKQLVIEHMKANHKYLANSKNQPSSSENHLYQKIHMGTNNKQAALRCLECSFIAKDENLLSMHYHIHRMEPKQPLKCNKCCFETKSEEFLKYHHRVCYAKAGEEMLKFRCHRCAFKTESGSIYSAHIRNCRVQTTSATDEEKEMLQYKCHKCNFKSETSSSFRAHTWLHMERLTFKCHICTFTTESSTSYLDHSRTCRIHMVSATATDEDIDMLKYKCNKCNFKSESSRSFRAHTQLHVNIFTFKCHICTFTTESRSSYLAHTRICRIHMTSATDEDIDMLKFKCKKYKITAGQK